MKSSTIEIEHMGKMEGKYVVSCGVRPHEIRINEKLGSLLTLLMEQSWHPESVTVSRKRMELATVKEYLDEHFTEKIMLEELAEKFFINKFYRK